MEKVLRLHARLFSAILFAVFGLSTTSGQMQTPAIDINSASITELESLPGVDAPLARSMILKRPFKKAEDLKSVGMSDSAIELIKPHIVFGKVQSEKPASRPAGPVADLSLGEDSQTASVERTPSRVIEARLKQAGIVLKEIMAAPDKGIPDEVIDHAKCIAVVPHLLRGGFVFGAEDGHGVAACRTANGWSAPAFFTITGGIWGLPIGVEDMDIVMVFQNDRGMQDLVSSHFEIGSDASAAAGPVGRHASAESDWKMNAEILTYSRAKGIFAGLTLNGATIRPDHDSTVAEYGREIRNREILAGIIPPPRGANAFLDAARVRQAAR